MLKIQNYRRGLIQIPVILAFAAITAAGVWAGRSLVQNYVAPSSGGEIKPPANQQPMPYQQQPNQIMNQGQQMPFPPQPNQQNQPMPYQQPMDQGQPMPYQQQPNQEFMPQQPNQPTDQRPVNGQQPMPYQQPMDQGQPMPYQQQPNQQMGQKQPMPYQQQDQPVNSNINCAPGTVCNGQENQNWQSGGQGMQNGQSEEQMQEMQKQNDERQFQNIKKDVSGMEKDVKRVETSLKNAAKKGAVVPQDLTDSLQVLKQQIATVKNAKTAEEIQDQDIDQGMMHQTIGEIDDWARQYQQVQDMKRMAKEMEKGIVSFEKQIAKLEKQKIVVPADIKGILADLKAAIAEIKNAKTPDDLENFDPQSIGDLMGQLNESRQQLDMLSRWPQTLKQITRQITQWDKDLKKTKTLADKLKVKGFDVTDDYNAFQEAVSQMKAVKGEVVAKISAGEVEEAFNLLEDEFFGKMDDVGERQRVINAISNLGRFTSDFKKETNAAQKQIKALEKKKLNVTELKDIYNKAVTKGNEITAMIKTKPLDEDAVSSAMEELEGLQQDFQNKSDELTGGAAMPWEQGKSQFNELKMPTGFEDLAPINPSSGQNSVPVPTNATQ